MTQDLIIKKITELANRHNSGALDRFEGLSPDDMHFLLYEPFSAKSPMQIRTDISEATFSKMPMFLLIEAYLKLIQREKEIKLTPKGALQQKVLVELYDKRFLLDEFIEMGLFKVAKEENWIAMQSGRFAVEQIGLVKKRNGKLSLTKKGEKLLEKNDRIGIFKALLEGFTMKFLWAYNDGYDSEDAVQFGWAFSM
jgi:predicted transcriptional regulator